MPRPSDHRITIRVTPEEYALIEAAAGSKPKSAFLREVALARAATRRKTAQRLPAETDALMGKVLATLMAYPLIAEFKRASKTAEAELDTEGEVHTKIRECHAFLKEIRDLLVTALRRSK
jgi:uncharacterized protein (DUF1778 family)